MHIHVGGDLLGRGLVTAGNGRRASVLTARVLAVPVCVLILAGSGCANRGAGDPPAASPASAGPTLERGEGLDAVEGSSAYVTGMERYDTPELPIPDKGESVDEPVFGTPITRLTDVESGEYEGPGIQNEYSRIDPENADGTLLLLRGNWGDWYLCTLGGGCELTSLADVFGECTADPEPRWDPDDPDLLYFVCGTQLRTYDVSTGDVEMIHDFSSDVPGAYAIAARSEGDSSRDRRYWAWTAVDEEFETQAVIVYDRQEDSVIGRLERDELTDEIDWVGMDVTGEHVLVGWESLGSLGVYSRDLREHIDLPRGSNAHGDQAMTADGRSVWVYQNVSTDYIAMADLATGEETPLLRIPFEESTDIGLHFSGNCVHTPGWVLVSTYGARTPATGDSHTWMDTQLLMLELCGEPRVWRLAHTRCYTAEHAEDEPEYFFEAFATVNAAGTHVYWGSNWGRLDPEYTDAFVAVLPDEWTSDLPD